MQVTVWFRELRLQATRPVCVVFGRTGVHCISERMSRKTRKNQAAKEKHKQHTNKTHTPSSQVPVTCHLLSWIHSGIVNSYTVRNPGSG